uniref:Hexosyltransferase n=1 Tax=Steinernema glaseri TaxID=37863 RepID=A0A1I7YNK9_9BILA
MFRRMCRKVPLVVLLLVVLWICCPKPLELTETTIVRHILRSNLYDADVGEESGIFLKKDATVDISNQRILRTPTASACEKNVELLVGIVSRPQEKLRRNEIRQTWASPFTHDNAAIRILFFVGRDERKVVPEEDDVIVLDYVENYYNLTLKTLGLLTYHRDFCGTAKCLLKVDSDVVVDLGGMLELCRASGDTPKIMGNSPGDWTPVIRDPTNKYFVPKHVYGHERYPSFIQGPAYMLSGTHVSRLILDALRETPFYHSTNFRRLGEDVVFNGIARALAGVKHAHTGGFSVFGDGKLQYWCPNGSVAKPLAFHAAGAMAEFWPRFLARKAEAEQFGFFWKFVACRLWLYI